MVQIVMGGWCRRKDAGWEGQTLPYTRYTYSNLLHRTHVFIHYYDALVAHNKRLQHASCIGRWIRPVLSSLSPAVQRRLHFLPHRCPASQLSKRQHIPATRISCILIIIILVSLDSCYIRHQPCLIARTWSMNLLVNPQAEPLNKIITQSSLCPGIKVLFPLHVVGWQW